MTSKNEYNPRFVMKSFDQIPDSSDHNSDAKKIYSTKRYPVYKTGGWRAYLNHITRRRMYSKR